MFIASSEALRQTTCLSLSAVIASNPFQTKPVRRLLVVDKQLAMGRYIVVAVHLKTSAPIFDRMQSPKELPARFYF